MGSGQALHEEWRLSMRRGGSPVADTLSIGKGGTGSGREPLGSGVPHHPSPGPAGAHPQLCSASHTSAVLSDLATSQVLWVEGHYSPYRSRTEAQRGFWVAH